MPIIDTLTESPNYLHSDDHRAKVCDMEVLLREEQTVSSRNLVGQMVALTIQEQLDQRLSFVDSTGQMDILKHRLEQLPSIAFSSSDIAEAYTKQRAETEKTAQQDRLATHQAMLTSQKVLAGCEPAQWRLIDATVKPHFAEALQEFGATETLPPATDVILTDERFDRIMSDLGSQIDELLGAVREAMPSPRQPVSLSRLQRFGRFLTGLDTPEYSPFIATDYDKLSDKQRAQISRKIKKLNDFLENLVQDPDSFMAGLLIETEREDLKKAATALLDQSISQTNKALLDALGWSTAKVHRPDHEYGSEIRRARRQTESTPESSQTRRIELDSELHSRFLGRFPTLMPWLSDEVQPATTIVEFTQGQGKIFMASGMDPTCKEISRLVRKQSPVDESGLTQYDDIEKYLARRMAGGNMPYHSANGIKRVKEVAGRFRDLKIWYSFDKSPNAPRVYFTLVKMCDLFGRTDFLPEAIEANNDCMVILAETDKAHQISVLQSLTVQKRKQLRAVNSGSI